MFLFIYLFIYVFSWNFTTFKFCLQSKIEKSVVLLLDCDKVRYQFAKSWLCSLRIAVGVHAYIMYISEQHNISMNKGLYLKEKVLPGASELNYLRGCI